jgi:GNAT superfamily N-acetyltransferase
MRDIQQPLLIRPVQAGDYEQWLVLWSGYQTFYEVSLSADITMTTFQRFLDSSEPVFCAVAEQNQQLIGMVTLVLHRSTWALTRYCYLEDLYVSPAIRGGGVGKCLIEWVQQFAKQHECIKLYWHTHQTNQQAQRLYNHVARQSGFIEYQMDLG